MKYLSCTCKYLMVPGILLMSLLACKKEELIPPPGPETVEDVDGNSYTLRTIGNQAWMIRNLATTHFNDGTPIYKETSQDLWGELDTAAYCWYNNDSLTYSFHDGALYNGYAVMSNKLCPEGTHVPTQDDWKELEVYLGLSPEQVDSISHRGSNEGDELKDPTGWINTLGSNKYGFSARASGYRHMSVGQFLGYGYGAYFWSSSRVILHSDTTSWIWKRQLEYDDSRIFSGWEDPQFGFSVRCIKD